MAFLPALSTLVFVLGALLLIAGAALFGLYLFLCWSLPKVNGTVKVSGLDAPVDVIRDSDGVPHIRAQNRRDAYMGLGYVHAQDRLWQMEYQRRFASGRLSEIFGPTVVKADQAIRAIGLRRAAESAVASLPAAARETIDSYVTGINQALRLHTGHARPVECRVLGVTIEPWTIVDVLACGKLLAWNLAGTYVGDLLRTDMIAKLGPERTAELMSFCDRPSSAAVPTQTPAGTGTGASAATGNTTGTGTGTGNGTGTSTRTPAAGASSAQIDEAAAWSASSVELHATGSEGVGSNQWVVDGTRTMTRKPMLANDPHLPIAMPGTWYLAHLSAPDLDLIGATVPGVPAVVSGRNRHIGWGVASLDVDVQDLFREPAEKEGTAEPAAAVCVSQWDETIRVRGRADASVRVRTTTHGPIISDMIPPRGADGPPTPPLALRWTALDDDDATLAAFIQINQARSWSEFSEAFRAYVAPVLLFTYADVDGNIGSRIAGRVPIRSGCDGSVTIAADSGGEWAGWVPFEEMPSLFNPASHTIVSANTREVDAGYPHDLGREHMEPHRRERITALLQADAAMSIGDHAAIQLDTLSTQARALLPLLLPHVQPDNAAQQTARELLHAWDCDMRGESAGAALFAAWWRELPKALAAQELGPDLFKAYELWPSYSDRFVRLCAQRLAGAGSGGAGSGGATGADGEDRKHHEAVRAAIHGSFAAAVAGLGQRLGANPARWRWDRLHRAVFAHRPFHRRRWLRPIVSRTLATGGDWSSVNVGGTWSYDQPFIQKYAASYRQILDLSTPDRGMFIQALGQSGHPLSPHYADMARRWQRGEYCPMRMSPDAIERDQQAVLRLQPEGANVPPSTRA